MEWLRGTPPRDVATPGEPGPHKVEQTRSHPHDVVFDPSGRFVLVPDKGLDRVFVFSFDAAAGTLAPTVQGAATSRPGAGPRHLAFHPALPVVWVLNELDSTVTTCRFDGDEWVLNGAKRWIGNASFADLNVIWARDVDDKQVKGFVVEKGTPGFSAEVMKDKIALRVVQNAMITLTDCRVPHANKLVHGNR